MSGSTDRRVIRTRRMLQDALLALMAEKPFRKIHVSEIAERAGIARPTFYLHFRSREDLLLSHMDKIFERYMLEIEPFLGLEEPEKLAATLFEQLQTNSTLIRLISESEDEITHLVMDRLQEYIRAIFGAFRLDPAPREPPPHIADFATASLTGSTYALVLQWVKADMPYPPEVMGKILMSLVRPGLVNVLLGDALEGFTESGV